LNDNSRIDRLEEELGDVRRELARYKGFVGGILAVISALAAFFELVLPFLKGLGKH
jgi:hypothetical protein